MKDNLPEEIIKVSWLYLHDRPCDLRSDLLWKERTTIRPQVTEIALRITEALLQTDGSSDSTSDSMTFAIHGGWGSGKSSVLRMIQQEVQQIQRHNPNILDKIKFCYISASSYQNLDADIRVMMAMRVLQTLAGDRVRAVRLFSEHSAAITDEDGRGGDESDARTLETRASAKLQRLSTTLAELIDFDALLASELSGRGETSNGAPQALVILVDDLDRCRPEFISEILDAVQQWSTVQNLFFILAIDEEALIRALDVKIPTIAAKSSPDYALEKYVQHTVTIPDMDEELLAVFVQELLGGYSDPVSKAIVEDVEYLQRGLQIKRPRAVKRCLNTIRPEIQQSLSSPAALLSRTERQLIIKERVLEYSWRHFYGALFVPAVKYRRRPFQAVFQDLERFCSQFRHASVDEGRLEFEISRVRTRLGDENFQIPLPLAEYLALPPYWLVRAPDGRAGQGVQPPGRGVPLPTVPEPTGDVLDLDEQLAQLYIETEAAEASRDRTATLRGAEQVYQLVSSNRQHFGEAACPVVGNVAVTAETLNARDLAQRLYELSVDLNPDHSNNLQNFVDFIIEQRVEDLYAQAALYLERLGSGVHAGHRPDRTLSLKLALAQRRGMVVPSDVAAAKQGLITEFMADPTNRRRFRTLMEFLGDVGDLKAARAIAKEYYQRAATHDQRYLGLRSLADLLANSSDENDEREAMEIYRWLYIHGVREDRAEWLHNYATLLFKHNYNREAGRVWFEGYGLNRAGRSARQAYAQYVLIAGRPDLAQAVSRGEPITEMVLRAEDTQLPERFSDEYDWVGAPDGEI